MIEYEWKPFDVARGLEGARGEAPRSIETLDGVGDRMRAAAFAEIQARDAFLWAAEHYSDAAPELKKAWRDLAREEDKHLNWLLKRMNELGIDVRARRVSDHLWHSLIACQSARDFAVFMASAEERGRRAGERFHEALRVRDPETARIFGQIAREEVAHIELAKRFFA
jgi:uncharacterized ferritin-like protein (DUF455 family)